MRWHLSRSKRFCLLTTSRCSHQKENNWHCIIFAGKHCEAQPHSRGFKGGQLHVLHSYFLSQARWPGSNLLYLFDIPLVCLTILTCLTCFICLMHLTHFTCLLPSTCFQGGFVPNTAAGFLLSRVQLIRSGWMYGWNLWQWIFALAGGEAWVLPFPRAALRGSASLLQILLPPALLTFPNNHSRPKPAWPAARSHPHTTTICLLMSCTLLTLTGALEVIMCHYR